jgi:hypothetical protein
MGFESFQVELSRDGPDHRPLSQFVRKLPHAKPDESGIQSSKSDYVLVDDGDHKIEIEVTEEWGRISCRFTLCHPPSIEVAFVNLVRDLVERLNMKVRICADESGRWYSAEDLADFSREIADFIAKERRGWIAQCGPTQLAATSSEAYEKIVFPQLKPVEGLPNR